ncbi:MAG: flagellar biosynthetic protein FliQ [Rhodospirillales bacterium]|nr:flagellar biosynthetic protein FliQ [Acetobacter sp.]
MGAVDVAALLRDCVSVILKIGMPILGVSLVVGLIVSFIQAITQINEATLAFLPKLMAIGATLMLAGSYMGATLGDFTRRLYNQIVAVGGS